MKELIVKASWQPDPRPVPRESLLVEIIVEVDGVPYGMRDYISKYALEMGSEERILVYLVKLVVDAMRRDEGEGEFERRVKAVLGAIDRGEVIHP